MSNPTHSMRLDKRLIRRRGWIASEELERALAELPDVSDKAAAPEERGAPSAGPSGGETPPEGAPPIP